MAETTSSPIFSEPRVDLLLVSEFVEEGARVLDVGCGDGTLLHLLATKRGVDGRGIELSQRGVNDCVAKGLSVIQGDADHDLDTYPDDAFDYVILSQTIQATHMPMEVLKNLLRIGRRAIVSIPNFGHWRIRGQLAFRGRMPVTGGLDHNWYDTPNIHLCTIRDFLALCARANAKVEQAVTLDSQGYRIGFSMPLWLLNLMSEQAVFVLSRGAGANEASAGGVKTGSPAGERESASGQAGADLRVLTPARPLAAPA